MAYGIVYEFGNDVDTAQYDAVNEKLGIDRAAGTGWPAGLQSHAAGTTPTGFFLYEVWDSKAAQESFMEARLGPALGAVGVPQPLRLVEVDIVSFATPDR